MKTRIVARLRAIARSRVFRGLVALVLVLSVWRVVRPFTLPAPPRPDDATFAQAKRVTIVRDTYGVPHVFGKTDPDTAFGLAYAHAEDDFATIQGVLAAGTGRLSLLSLSETAIGNDFYVGFVGVREQVDAHYMELSPAYRALLEGYARGLNLYAYLHPREADGRLFPMTGRDLAAGFVHKIPLMFEMHKILGRLAKGAPVRAGDELHAARETQDRAFPGSNAQAVARGRSTDDTARLNVNSHQPWEGPVTWYEAHVVSEEGWNVTGGLFPGAPMPLVGHNDDLGWAHTVNYPDLVDVYALEVSPDHPDAYAMDGAFVPFGKRDVPITIDTGLFAFTVHETAYTTEHGPAIRTKKGAWAVRYGGIDRAIFSGEQWYRMNRARTFDEWRAAMRIGAIPMFNTVYADREHVHYVYNAALPKRAAGVDWSKVLPGNRRDLVWHDYLSQDELPHVTDPKSGFVQACNSSPFVATTGEGTPEHDRFDASLGILDPVTNRARRSLALLGDPGKPVSRNDFLAMKWDDRYADGSLMHSEVVVPVTTRRFATAREEEGRAMLARWDLRANADSKEAALAILTWRAVNPDVAGGKKPAVDIATAFSRAIGWLLEHFGRLDVPLGEVQRLRRGSTDLPIGGGPDVLNATYTSDKGDRLVGTQGDSYVLFVELGKEKTMSHSIHQYGASCREGSRHHADQAPLFVRHELKPTFRDRAELAAHTERSYVPGE